VPVTDPLNNVHETVSAVYLSDSRRVLATLIRLLGDFDAGDFGAGDFGVGVGATIGATGCAMIGAGGCEFGRGAGGGAIAVDCACKIAT